ncbi:mechanosensitive ion channel family protein [Thiocapsa bogorovii]|uniref:mechanosensitive ion channel family protein n=1 Tax=Thiocapsa bogorovii TaxID=521689 RepID=UPI001E3B3522|nr:mechanosensitive ion channel family protein [Thiocapsa bogorovii]UHD17851.1 mechanosensitive ion channel family protein [Thiocapsa bogorovii]
MTVSLILLWLPVATVFAAPLAIEPLANPLRPPDTSSPQATARSLIRNLEEAYEIAKDPERSREDTLAPLRRARRTLDLSEVPAEFAADIGLEAALLIKETIDRVGLPPYEEIPDAERVAIDELSKWRIPSTEITIAEVQEGPRTGEWLFSPTTVDLAESFYERVSELPYQPGATPGLYGAYSLTPGAGLSLSWGAGLPSWLGVQVLGQTAWQWIAGVSVLLSGFALGVVAYRAGRRADKRRREHDRISRRGTVMALLFGVALLQVMKYFINEVVNFTGRMLILDKQFFVILEYALLGWLAVLILNQIPELVIRSRRLRPRGIDSQLLRLGFKLLAFVAIAALVVDGAQRIGLPAYSVITGLGVGGLAVALAARETLANLLGSLAIMLDRPFRIGDWIKMDGKEGTVEDIGFRSTRIRTFYDSLLSVPNSVTVNTAIDNMGERAYRRVSTKLNIRYDTGPERIEAFLEGIKEIIKANPATRKDYFHVVMHDFGPHGLDVLLYFFLQVPDWSAELVERQRVFIEIMRLAERLGVDFAFPTQTIEVESMPGQPHQARPAQEPKELSAVARNFGTQGNDARPRGLGLFTPPCEER